MTLRGGRGASGCPNRLEPAGAGDVSCASWTWTSSAFAVGGEGKCCRRRGERDSRAKAVPCCAALCGSLLATKEAGELTSCSDQLCGAASNVGAASGEVEIPKRARAFAARRVPRKTGSGGF